MTDDLPTPPLPELTPITRVWPGPEEKGLALPSLAQSRHTAMLRPDKRRSLERSKGGPGRPAPAGPGTMLTMVQLEAEPAVSDTKKPLSGSEFSAVVAAVTSAFGDPTRRQVYLYVRDSATGVTASQVALRFSLHPNVARHHLDKLAAGGYLEVFSARAQVGRSGTARRSCYRASGPTPVLETSSRERSSS